jgi:hypothetical protein
LYPALNEVAEKLPHADGFRLRYICEVKDRLEVERAKRAGLYKKYRRGVNVCEGIDTALLAASLGLGASGVGLLATVIAAPVVVGLEVAALSCGLAGATSKFIARRLQRKAKKHDEIRVMAEAKINSISDHISKALEDDRISDGEFTLIVSEERKFSEGMAKIRLKHHKGGKRGVSEAEKNSLILQGRESVLASMRED